MNRQFQHRDLENTEKNRVPSFLSLCVLQNSALKHGRPPNRKLAISLFPVLVEEHSSNETFYFDREVKTGSRS